MTAIADTKSVAVVLVHGGFVDGSGWEDMYKILKKDGYDVSIVQNPTISLADDVAVTKRVLAKVGQGARDAPAAGRSDIFMRWGGSANFRNG